MIIEKDIDMLAILSILLTIVLIAAVFYGIVAILGVIGFPVPAKVQHLLAIALGLVALIWLLQGDTNGFIHLSR